MSRELNLNLSGSEFVQLMEKYRIKPSELGITSHYKLMLKRNERRPSRDLVIKLYKRVKEIEGELAPGGGFEPPTTGLTARRSTG